MKNYKMILWQLGMAMGCAGGLTAAELYVAPTGTPAGTGTQEKPVDILTAISAKSPAKPGDTIYLLGGAYNGPMTQDVNHIPLRLPFDVKVSGTADQPIRILPAPGAAALLNGTVQLDASYLHLINLDIGDLQWDPWQLKHKNSTALNVTGGESAKVINCNIFGGAMGSGCWSTAKNLELYGNLIHDFGYLVPDPSDPTKHKGRGHGHCYYAQNEEGTKIFQDNIAYRGCGWNVHIYTQGGMIKGFDVISNICYIAGAYVEGQNMDNFLCYGKTKADRIRFIDNIAYQPQAKETWRPNARLANVYTPQLNGTAVVSGNYFMGSFYGLSLSKWENITVASNTLWSLGVFLEISSSATGSGIKEQPDKPDLAGYHVDNNTYFDNGKTNVFYYGNKEKKADDELSTFAQWQALGLDKHSQVLSDKGGKPTGTKVFVYANKYQPGRAQVGIFNWDGQDQIDVDLAPALKAGQKFAVYNCLDISQTLAQAKPIVTAVYAGKPLSIPLRKDKISPDFDAFLVVPQ